MPAARPARPSTARLARPSDRAARPPASATRGSHNGAVAGSEGTPAAPPRRGARRAAKPKRSLQPAAAAARPRRAGGAGRVGRPGLAGRSTSAAPPAVATRASGSSWPPPSVGAVACLFLCLLLVHPAAAPGRDPRGSRAAGADAPARARPARQRSARRRTNFSADQVSSIAATLTSTKPELEAEVADPVLVEVAGRCPSAFWAAFLGQQTQTMPAVDVRSNSVGSRLRERGVRRVEGQRHVERVGAAAGARPARRRCRPGRGRRARGRGGRRARP